MPTVRLEGFHAVKHALRFAPDLVVTVTCADPQRLLSMTREFAPDLLDVLPPLARQGPVAHHTGVQADAVRPAPPAELLGSREGTLVLLDEPRDAGNVGAVVRVCAAAGAAGVAVTGALDPWQPAALRGAAGLHYAVPVLACTPEQVAGPVVLLDPGGDPDLVLPAGAVLVVGSERRGISELWRGRADAALGLPMRPGVSSLNLATAVAAALYRRPPQAASASIAR